jgi:predicted RNA polymerase sigma factor
MRAAFDDGQLILRDMVACCRLVPPRTITPGPVHRLQTDWSRIVALYGALAQVAPSPVMESNRAFAVGMADGAEAVRGDLRVKLGRHGKAASEFSRAATLTRNWAERELLAARAQVASTEAGSERRNR